MLSRVANSIYWINRFIERAENYARMIDVNLNLTLDLPLGVEEQWRPLVMTTGDEELFLCSYDNFSRENVIHFLSFDARYPNSIVSCLAQARENARTVREIISSEMWEQINELYISILDALGGKQYSNRELAAFFRHIKLGSHLFSGITEATLSRSEIWHFSNLGRFMERADKTARILDMKYFYLLPVINYVGTPFDLLQWSALLRSASAYEMYRKQFGKLEVSNIVHFLVLDRYFPRAIHYCIHEAQDSLHAILGTNPLTFSTNAEKELGKLSSELDYTDVTDIFQFSLHEFLDALQGKLNTIGVSINETFFDVVYA